MRNVRKLFRDERRGQAMESVLLFGAALVVGIGVIVIVVQKVTEKLNDYDTATRVIVHEQNYKFKNKNHR